MGKKFTLSGPSSIHMQNIFVFGYQNEASGKTTISIAIARSLVNAGLKVGVLKPVSAHNFWYQYDETLRCLESGTIFSEDIYRLAMAAKVELRKEILNPVDRLISQPDIEVYEPPSPISRIIMERITTPEKDMFLVNANARKNLILQDEIINDILKDKEIRVCKRFKEWDDFEKKNIPEAIESCYSYLCQNKEINVIESFNDQIPVLLPDLTKIIMVVPGSLYIYDPKDLARCFKFNVEAKGRLLGRDVFEQLKPVYVMKVSPLRKDQLEDYDLLANDLGTPILQTLDVL